MGSLTGKPLLDRCTQYAVGQDTAHDHARCQPFPKLSFRAFLGAGLIPLLFLLLLASTARAVSGEEVTGLPLRDSLKRSETLLSNGKRWLAIKGGTGFTGQDTANGWGPLAPFPSVEGAYWSANTFVDGPIGDGAMLTVGTEPGIESRYVSLWLNMPDPANARSGYELRWTQTKPPSIYTVALYKWVAGTSTTLTSKEFVSIYSGTRMGISDSGGVVQAWWKGNEEVAHSILSANDTTYSGGYAGIEGSGNLSRSSNFQAGALVGSVFSTAPALDTLERQEVPLATGKWSKTSWAAEIGGAWSGTVYHGFGANSGASIAGAYWNPAAFTDGNGGDFVAANIGSGLKASGEYSAVWLNMPSPASVRSGYEARIERNASYGVELAKWANGTRTVLGSVTKSSIPIGSGLALSEDGGGLTVWLNTDTAGFRPVLLANDGSYASGYAGLEVYGIDGTINNFRAGVLRTPSKPTIKAVSPAGPANNNKPLISGSAETGTTVQIYTNSSCTGAALSTGAAATFASPGVTANVADNTTTTFYATATNGTGTSACSSPSTPYKEDSAAPPAPKLNTTSPPSPSTKNVLLVIGSAEAGTTVRLYPNSSCGGPIPSATGSAATLASPGVSFGVIIDSATSISATAVDAAGNVSPCSNELFYVHDSSSPQATFTSGFKVASPSEYELHIHATDAMTGVREVGVALNGIYSPLVKSSCTQNLCPRAVDANWTHLFAQPPTGGDQVVVSVVDLVGNRKESAFRIPSKVVRATVYSGNPTAGGELLAEEWAQPQVRLERRATPSQTQTRGIGQCPEEPAAECVIRRTVRLPEGGTGQEPGDGAVSEISAPLEDAGEVSDPATIMLPSRSEFGSTIGTGNESSILQTWQVPPRGSGAIYETLKAGRAAEGSNPAESETFWIDAATKLPLKAEIIIGNATPAVSFYSYPKDPVELAELPSNFFMAETQAQSGCTNTANIGGWSFSPSGAVYPDSRFSSMVNTSDGQVILAPMGAANDGPAQRANLTPAGVRLSSVGSDISNLEWEVNFSPEQKLAAGGNGVVFVETRGGEKVAEISASQGSPTVVDGVPSDGELVSTGDKIVLAPGSGSIEVQSTTDPSPSDIPCFTSNEVSAAAQQGKASEASKAAYYSTASTQTTSQIKVWVNPHPGVGNVQVTVQGPCSEHQKLVGADGQAVFGGCDTGSTYTVSVPELVHQEDRHYQEPAHVRQFTLPKAGHVVEFNYNLVATDPPPGGGGGGGGPAPPPRNGTVGVEFIPDGPEALGDETATASWGGLPIDIQFAFAHEFEFDDCAAVGRIPYPVGQRGAYAIQSVLYTQCIPANEFFLVKTHATLEEAHILASGALDTWNERDRLGPEGVGVRRAAASITKPSFGGPYFLKDGCTLAPDFDYAWRTLIAVWGVTPRPPGLLLSAKYSHERLTRCR